MDIAAPTVLRTLSGYCIEWDRYMSFGVYDEDHSKQFTFKRGCFDADLKSGKDVALTMDLDGKTIFARTGDGTLTLTTDDIGLLATVTLVDSPINQRLVRAIDSNRIRGWSHSWGYVFGGWRVRTENGIQYHDHYRAVLKELTLVVRKVPRQKNRGTPVFLTGGPQRSVAHV